MKPPKKRRNRIIEVGSGLSRVRIYTINRSDGYPQFAISWKEGGRRQMKSFAQLDEARLVAQQTMVRLANYANNGGNATLRDIEMLLTGNCF